MTLPIVEYFYRLSLVVGWTSKSAAIGLFVRLPVAASADGEDNIDRDANQPLNGHRQLIAANLISKVGLVFFC